MPDARAGGVPAVKLIDVATGEAPVLTRGDRMEFITDLTLLPDGTSVVHPEGVSGDGEEVQYVKVIRA